MVELDPHRLRTEAATARRVATTVSDVSTRRSLIGYAEECEAKAAWLEGGGPPLDAQS